MIALVYSLIGQFVNPYQIYAHHCIKQQAFPYETVAISLSYVCPYQNSIYTAIKCTLLSNNTCTLFQFNSKTLIIPQGAILLWSTNNTDPY